MAQPWWRQPGSRPSQLVKPRPQQQTANLPLPLRPGERGGFTPLTGGYGQAPTQYGGEYSQAQRFPTRQEQLPMPDRFVPYRPQFRQPLQQPTSIVGRRGRENVLAEVATRRVGMGDVHVTEQRQPLPLPIVPSWQPAGSRERMAMALAQRGPQVGAALGQGIVPVEQWYQEAQQRVAAAGLGGGRVPIVRERTPEEQAAVTQTMQAISHGNLPTPAIPAMPSVSFPAVWQNIQQARLPFGPEWLQALPGRVPAALGEAAAPVVGGVMQGLMAGAREVEHGIGGLAVGVEAAKQAAAQGLPLPEQARVFGAGYQMGTREAGPVIYSAVGEQFAQNVPRIGGAEWARTTEQAPEAARRLQLAREMAAAGATPQEIAEKAGQPVYEAIGQTLLDPLNVFIIWASARRHGWQAGQAARYVREVDPRSYEQIKAALSAGKEARPFGYEGMAEAIIFGPRAEAAKASTLVEDTSDVLTMVTSTAKTPEEALARVRALYDLEDASPTVVETARATLADMGTIPDSRAGKQATVFLRDLATNPETGALDFSRISRAMGKGEEGMARLLDESSSMYYKVKPSPAGGLVGQTFLEHNPLKRFQNAVNGAFAKLYLGYGPYAARNWWSNKALRAVHGFLPFSNPFRKAAWMDRFGVSLRAAKRAMAGAVGLDVMEGKQLGMLETYKQAFSWEGIKTGPSLIIAQGIERADAADVYYSAARATMKDTWRYGRTITPDAAVDSLPRATRSWLVRQVEGVLDPAELKDVVRQVRSKGPGDLWRVPDVASVRQVNPEFADEILKAGKQATDPEDFAKRLDALLQEADTHTSTLLTKEAPQLPRTDPAATDVQKVAATKGNAAAGTLEERIALGRQQREVARAMAWSQIQAVPPETRRILSDISNWVEKNVVEAYRTADEATAQYLGRQISYDAAEATKRQVWEGFVQQRDALYQRAISQLDGDSKLAAIMQQADDTISTQAMMTCQKRDGIWSAFRAGEMPFDAAQSEVSRLWDMHNRYAVTKYDEAWRMLGGIPERGPLAVVGVRPIQRSAAVLRREMADAAKEAGVSGVILSKKTGEFVPNPRLLNTINKDREALGLARVKRLADLDEPGMETAIAGLRKRAAGVPVAEAKAVAPVTVGPKEPWQFTLRQFRAEGDKVFSNLEERWNRILYADDSMRLPVLSKVLPPDRQTSLIAHPPKTVTIYRGIPAEAEQIRPGDWVALDRRYARLHTRGRGAGAKVVKLQVPAEDVVWAGTDENEFFYAPKSLIPGVIDETAHKSLVRQALAEGKPVSPEVLADYPDLAARPVAAEAAPAIGTEAIEATEATEKLRIAQAIAKDVLTEVEKGGVEAKLVGSVGREALTPGDVDIVIHTQSTDEVLALSKRLRARYGARAHVSERYDDESGEFIKYVDAISGKLQTDLFYTSMDWDMFPPQVHFAPTPSFLKQAVPAVEAAPAVTDLRVRLRTALEAMPEEAVAKLDQGELDDVIGIVGRIGKGRYAQATPDEVARAEAFVAGLERPTVPEIPTQPEQVLATITDDLNAPTTLAASSAENVALLRRQAEAIRTEILAGATAGKDQLTPRQLQQIEKWINGLVPNLNQAKFVAAKVGSADRDFVLLNYGDKRVADAMLAHAVMFGYWPTHTALNVARSFVNNPALLASFMRYKQAQLQVNKDLPKQWQKQFSFNLFGNQVYANLEQQLNPLYNMTNDFIDRDQGTTPTGQAMAAIRNLGVGSIWTPFVWAYALSRAQAGDEEGARAWAGYLGPPTRTFTYATALAREYGVPGIPPGGIVLEPWQYQGGLFIGGDKWEWRRVPVALYGMVRDGSITYEQMIDANWSQTGPVWEQGLQKARMARAPGQMAGFLLGQGFKMRFAYEVEIDRASDDWYRLMGSLDTMPQEQKSASIDAFYTQYPWYSGVQMGRKTDVQRDIALAWNVLNRLPPGTEKQSILSEVSMPDELLTRFYDDPDISTWKNTDHDRFMAAVLDIAERYKMPDAPTQATWKQVKNSVSNVYKDMAVKFPGYEAEETAFYNIKEEANRNVFLKSHPNLTDAWDYKRDRILADPVLFAYYGKPTMAESSARDALEAAANQRFPGMREVSEQINQVRDAKGDWQSIADANPQVYDYWEYKRIGREFIETLPPPSPTGAQAIPAQVRAQPTLAELRLKEGATMEAITPPPMQPVVTTQPVTQPIVPIVPSELPITSNVKISQWKAEIDAAATDTGLDPRVIAAVMQLESRGNPSAESKIAGRARGAIGLMQVMPQESGPEFTDRPTADELLDPATNVLTGARILKSYVDLAGGDVQKGLAYYYGGRGVSDENAKIYQDAFNKAWSSLWGEGEQPGVPPAPPGIAATPGGVPPGLVAPPISTTEYLARMTAAASDPLRWAYQHGDAEQLKSQLQSTMYDEADRRFPGMREASAEYSRMKAAKASKAELAAFRKANPGITDYWDFTAAGRKYLDANELEPGGTEAELSKYLAGLLGKEAAVVAVGPKLAEGGLQREVYPGEFHLGPRRQQYRYRMRDDTWEVLPQWMKDKLGGEKPYITPLYGEGGGGGGRSYGGGWGGGGRKAYAPSPAKLMRSMSQALLEQLRLYFIGGGQLEQGALNELAALGITDVESLRSLFALPLPMREIGQSGSTWRKW